ncbi:regulator of nonsense transcripts UPF3-like isoform X3 [Canna indica]|uniref:Regulator of nonsense transcripts UPF3-like isoform X3 n=1 Tax=Canna indica TaxID=4628 RepID=A0AAQ3KQV4_9LILI|nr:regulator of nonsense transcripts UPF3-like isoform X3 [Canna indica]
MKDPSDRTKVVVRRLPPSISEVALVEQIDGRFAGRYDWFSFRPGKNSQKDYRHSQAYINFKKPEDVVEFAEFFDGHIFVNEKGAQFKVLVEYAPSQRVPKPWSKKDGRDGTILKDPEYMEFLELISKPVEHLPSAEIQLERKEAERAGSTKETLIVTPLMDFVRRKRAAKSGTQRISGSGKVSKRASGVSAGSSSPVAKRGSERRKYVLRDSTRKGSLKDKPPFILMSRKDDQQSAMDKSVSVPSTLEKEALGDDLAPGVAEPGKGRFVLLKGKEKDVSDTSRALVQQQIVTSMRSSPTSTSRHNQASRRIIKSILLKEGRPDQSYTTSHPEQQMQAVNVEKDKRPPRPPNPSSHVRDHISRSSSLASVSDGDDKKYMDDKVAVNNKHGSVSISDKHEKRTRNKERPDRGVWAPLRRPDRSQSSEGIPQSSETTQMLTGSLESVSISQYSSGKVGEEDVVQNARVGRNSNSHSVYETSLGYGERKADRSDDMKIRGGRVDFSALENGSHRHIGRRGPVRGPREVDSSLNLPEGKSSKRGSSVYSSHERQIWVQKSGSAS